ncbi:MAG: hypothetical protein C4533_03355 [Candidatus Omnitrophota bacterium]|jgi:KDO2-lipid IV(A) lauroyltransferase|nr:MAG: hypothetical protein C4533_03355 [Candidatus Omnitrophota bacterium]
MFNYIFYRIGQFIALFLPLKVAYKFAVFVSDVHYIFANIDRKNVTRNLKVIFPDKTDREISVIRREMFRNFAKYLVDFFRFPKLNRQYIEKNIKIINIENFDEAIKRKKGAIVLTAHLGNWELGGVVTALMGYPLYAVALEHKHKRVNDFFNFQRESKGMRVIPLKKAVRQSLNALRGNNLLALVGDRDFTGKGIPVEFFNKQACLPEGPAALSLRTGAVIIPGFMVRNPNDSFTLTIEKPIEYAATGDNAVDIKNIINIYKSLFEKFIRKYPEQWYMFRYFWKDEDRL